MSGTRVGSSQPTTRSMYITVRVIPSRKQIWVRNAHRYWTEAMPNFGESVNRKFAEFPFYALR
jgi:hypothetical protein